MKILVVSAFLATLGILPVYAYTNFVEPQINTLHAMYGSMDATSADIAAGKDLKKTETYHQAQKLSAGWEVSSTK